MYIYIYVYIYIYIYIYIFIYNIIYTCMYIVPGRRRYLRVIRSTAGGIVAEVRTKKKVRRDLL
jgi:hypothetical protein